MNNHQNENTGRRRKHKWTLEDLDVVLRDYDGSHDSIDRIAKKLGGTPAAVSSQIYRPGFARPTHRVHRPWSPQEDALLSDYLGRYANAVVARKMNRSIGAIVSRSKRLRISLGNRDDWYTQQEACDILGVHHRWLRRRIDEGSLKASPHTDTVPTQDGRAAWHISKKISANSSAVIPETSMAATLTFPNLSTSSPESHIASSERTRNESSTPSFPGHCPPASRPRSATCQIQAAAAPPQRLHSWPCHSHLR